MFLYVKYYNFFISVKFFKISRHLYCSMKMLTSPGSEPHPAFGHPLQAWKRG